MPAVKVLLGGTVRDFRLGFRSWDDRDDKDLDGSVISGREAMEWLV